MTDHDLNAIQGIAAIVAALGAIVAALWAAWTYAQARRKESAKWVSEVVVDYLTHPRFLEMRELIFDYQVELSEIVDGWLHRRYPDVSYTPEVMRRTMALDDLLNYFEFMLHLEEQHHISPTDRKAVVSWWITTFWKPQFANLRIYIQRYEWTRLSRELALDGKEYLALSPEQQAGIDPEIWTQLSSALEPWLPDVWHVKEPANVWSALDEAMGYVPRDRERSTRIRRCSLTLPDGHGTPGSSGWRAHSRPRDGRPTWSYIARTDP